MCEHWGCCLLEAAMETAEAGESKATVEMAILQDAADEFLKTIIFPLQSAAQHRTNMNEWNEMRALLSRCAGGRDRPDC